MTTLIEKLQAAEEGSPELSADVLAEFWPEFIWEPQNKFKTGGGYKLSQDRKLEKKPWLDVTQSIDAALTLLSDDMRVRITQYSEFWTVSALFDYGNEQVDIEHKSLPIAICIAALRANTNKQSGVKG